MEKITKFLVLLALLNSVKCSNILGIFPTPSISHQVVFHALMKDLAVRGHHLTILTTDVIKSLEKNPNVTQIDLHFTYETFRNGANFVDFKVDKNDETELMNFFFPIMMVYLEEQFEHPEVKKLINQRDNYHFDLIIVENLMYTPILAFGELYNAPIIGITSLDAPRACHLIIGNEANPIVHPELAFPFVNKQPTFYERYRILRYLLHEKYFLNEKFNDIHRKFLKKYFPNITLSVDELNSQIDLMMTNAHPALGFIRPVTPTTIQLGFMHIEPPKTLPEGELKSFMDNSKEGVIYMSFGSNVQSKDLDDSIKNIFLKVFGEMKNYNFIWKFEADDLPNKPSNLLISKWLPQSDLLAHPNLKLFITQGGQQSMEEAIDREVPMIVVPFLGDQEANANRVVSKKIGLYLELEDLTEETLRSFIKEGLKSEYKRNIVKLRELVYDQPMTSREKAVWWTEYVIRHRGTKHLEYHGTKIPFYQRFFLDFIAIAITAVLLIFFTLTLIYRKFLCNNDKKFKTQ